MEDIVLRLKKYRRQLEDQLGEYQSLSERFRSCWPKTQFYDGCAKTCSNYIELLDKIFPELNQ